MRTEFEAEVREEFAARAGRLPVGAASRLRSIDYGPREHRLRAPAIGMGALAGAATAGTALAVVLGGSTPAYAGWSATPTSAAAPSPAADASCQSQLSGTHPGPAGAGADLGSGAWQSVLTDVRGPFTVALFQDDGAYAACFTSASFTEINQVAAGSGQGAESNSVGVQSGSASGGGSPGSGLSGTVVGGTSSGALQQVTQTHLSISGDGPYTLVDGRAASGVTGVTLVLDDGQDVVATVDDGWLVAWWPGGATATSSQVTTQSGTTSEALVTGARIPFPPPGSPGSCRVERERRHVLPGVLGWSRRELQLLDRQQRGHRRHREQWRLIRRSPPCAGRSRPAHLRAGRGPAWRNGGPSTLRPARPARRRVPHPAEAARRASSWPKTVSSAAARSARPAGVLLLEHIGAPVRRAKLSSGHISKRPA